MQIPDQMDAPGLNAAPKTPSHGDPQAAPASRRAARARRRAGSGLAKITNGSRPAQPVPSEMP
jgi:hypothetical protein